MPVKDVRETNAMRALRSLVVAVVATVVLAVPAVVLADGRVALVVGNSTYAHIGRLPNPDTDAADISAALRRLGFEVTTELDADRVELTEALRRFTRQSAGADVSLVFYAGHGIEMDGVNYLVPVDARLERDIDVRFETVTVDDLLVSTSGASLRLVILDACRNNPLARSMQRTAATRSVSGGSFGDLNEDLLGDETLVAYAAAAGTTAADGRGRNSPYTAALLSHLETPLEIGLLFRRVRAQVLASTNGAQRTHEYHSLVGEHYLSVPPTADSVTVVAAAAPVPDVVPVDVDLLDVAQLRLLAEQGDARAQTELGGRYEEGRGGLVQDYEAAVALYRRAAEQGDVRGQGNLGAMYSNGWGVPQDNEVAVSWYLQAVEQGDARAQNGLGSMHLEGHGGVLQDEIGKPSAGSASLPIKDTPAGRPVLASCTTPVVGQGRTTRLPFAGTGERPNRALPPHSGISVLCTATVVAYRRTIGLPCPGIVARSNRGSRTRRSTLAACTATVVACHGTMRKPSDGIVARPNRGTPTVRPTSGTCTSRVAGCSRIAWKPCGGIVVQRSSAIPGRRSDSIFFGELSTWCTTR